MVGRVGEVKEVVETWSASVGEGAGLQGGEMEDVVEDRSASVEEGTGFLLGLLSCPLFDVCEGRLEVA